MSAPAAPARVASVDAYRGLVMLMMLAEVLRLSALSPEFPAPAVGGWVRWFQTHAAWRGLRPDRDPSEIGMPDR